MLNGRQLSTSLQIPWNCYFGLEGGNMIETNYSNRLNFLRRKMELSQKEAAYLLGYLDRTMISKYEHGHIKPTFLAALKFQILYQTALPEIFPDVFAELKHGIHSRLLKRKHKIQ